MFERGRHDKHRESYDKARYHLRKGIAKTALRMKREAAMNNQQGQPLKYARDMAEGVSEKGLERIVRNSGSGRKVMITV